MMGTSRYVKRLGHWRTLLNLATVSFTLGLFALLLGPSVPRRALGPSTPRLLQSVVQWGLYTSVLFFFLAFASLVYQQRTSDGA